MRNKLIFKYVETNVLVEDQGRKIKCIHFLKSKGLPWVRDKERNSTNKIFTILYLKTLTNTERQGKDFCARNKEMNVPLFADTWITYDNQ